MTTRPDDCCGNCRFWFCETRYTEKESLHLIGLGRCCQDSARGNYFGYDVRMGNDWCGQHERAAMDKSGLPTIMAAVPKPVACDLGCVEPTEVTVTILGKPKAKSCETCYWWERYDDPEQPDGCCHLNPPVALVTDDNMDWRSVLPASPAENYCSKHKP